MARMLPIDEVDDTLKTPQQIFKAKYQEVDGQKILVVETNNEVITRSDGTRDVIIHAPTLDLINKFNKEQAS